MTLWLALAVLLAGAPPAAAPVRVLSGATLIDGTGAPPVPQATVVVRDGRIECAGRNCAVPKGAAMTDVSGLWILPGLIDAHVHFGQSGWADARPDSFDLRERFPYEKAESELALHPEKNLRADLCSGVTSVFDNGGYPWSIDLAHRERDDPNAPRVAAAGPLLSTIDFWLNLPAERQFLHLKDAGTARSDAKYLAARGADAVKIWFIVTPEQTVEASTPAVLAAAEEARRLGLPLIVHATGLAQAKVALKAGAHLLVHSVDDAPVDDEFLQLAKANATVYCPTLTVMHGYLRQAQSAASGKPPALDDPNGCVDRALVERITAPGALPAAGAADQVKRLEPMLGGMTSTMAANLKRVSDAGIPIAMGTDAGNPLTLHGPSVYAEMEAMQAAGLTPMQVIVAATQGGSRAMGAAAVAGTLEKGKSADLIVVAADPTRDVANLRKIRLVMRAGVLRPQEELRAPASPR
ncbi:MAG TPA: amidohydrolase family protein [Thermoanaerobaculia bacterium]|nr:amidohydrolase family protein [Thermoanaerobaculia bacterium]